MHSTRGRPWCCAEADVLLVLACQWGMETQDGWTIGHASTVGSEGAAGASTVGSEGAAAGQLGSCHEGVVQEGGDSSSSSTETVRGGSICGHVARRGVQQPREGICHNVGCPWHVDNVSCTFSNECKLPLLPGRPRLRDSVESSQQRLVVGPQPELSALQGIPEVANGSEGGQ